MPEISWYRLIRELYEFGTCYGNQIGSNLANKTLVEVRIRSSGFGLRTTINVSRADPVICFNGRFIKTEGST